MPIQTTHRGHVITYGENSDEWYCSDLGKSHASLAKLKTAIDKMYLDLRKKAAVPCFEIGSYHRAEKTESTVIEYIDGKWERPSYFSSEPERLVDHKVAVVARRGGNERASRRETTLSQLMPDTPEALAAFAEFERLDLIARDARKVADDAFKAIPRMTVEDIPELVRIKKTEGMTNE